MAPEKASFPSTDAPQEALDIRYARIDRSRRRCRSLLSAVLVLGSLAIVHAYLRPTLVHRVQTPVEPAETDICLTPACIHASSEILYNLSPKYKDLDPCADFEELVCGGWRERHDLRPDQGDAFTGTIMSENSQLLLRHILEAPYPNSSSVCHCTREPI